MFGSICKHEDHLLFMSASLVSSAFHSLIHSRHGKCNSPSGDNSYYRAWRRYRSC